MRRFFAVLIIVAASVLLVGCDESPNGAGWPSREKMCYASYPRLADSASYETCLRNGQ